MKNPLVTYSLFLLITYDIPGSLLDLGIQIWSISSPPAPRVHIPMEDRK